MSFNSIKLNFRKAELFDVKPVFDFVRKSIKNMDSQGIFQWDELYPVYEDFEQDINKGEAFVAEIQSETNADENIIAAFYVLNRDCDDAYKNGKWQYCGEDYIVLHRFCVNPEFQNKGIGYEVCLHIIDKVKQYGIKAIRLDVFSQNPFSLRLYEKLGFETTGYANWRKGRFLLQEKIL